MPWKPAAVFAAIALPSAAVAIAIGFAVSSLDNGQLDRDGDGLVQTMIVGDSLAAAFYATTEDDGFARIVEDAIGPVEAFTTAQAHQTLATVAGVTDIPSGVEVVVIELGTNDVGQETTVASFEEQYLGLAYTIRAQSPLARVVCLGTWTGWGDEYDDAIERSCAFVDGTYVDAAEMFNTAANRGPAGRPTFVGPGDDFHPNDLGHRAIATAVLSALNTPA